VSDTTAIIDNPDIPSPEVVETLKSAIASRGWRVKTLRDAIETPDTEPPWIIDGLVLGDSSTLISALPKRMKSLSWLQACIEAPALHTVWGHFAAPKVERALFIETEDPAWLVEARIRGLAKGLGLSSDTPGFNYLCTGPFDLLTTGKELIPMAYEIYKPDFMVFSTLQNMIPGKSMTEQKDMAAVMATIIDLARKCCPSVLVTHSPQDDKKRRAAGSVTISANFVVEGHYKASDAEGKAVHVQLRSKAGSGISDFSLELETEGAGNDPSAVRRIVYTGKGETQSRSEQASLILQQIPK
jgi:hypothetical protein